MSTLFVVGTGPGDAAHLTPAARSAIERSRVVVGYKTYLELIAPLLQDKEVISSGMMKEAERCRQALEAASGGKTVALVSGGDAGIYGMAGLVLELAEEMLLPPQIEVVPGVSAVQAAAAVLGAPLMHDFAVISLSDLLTPWETIRRRLRAAADADFVTALYNPKSAGRVTQIGEAREILLSRRSPHTPVGIVRNALRAGEEKTVTTLADMLSHPIDMFTLVIVGNSATRIDGAGRMVTPRGYAAKAQGPGLKAQGETEAALRPAPCALRRGEGAARAVMFAGTGSDVGKSLLTAGFCRILKRRGVSVAPFKSQNMALNSAVTPEGGEIGRAQALQAEACGLPPHTDMNPVLLKPCSDTGSQVIVQGRPVGNMRVSEYNLFKPEAFCKVRESFERLAAAHRVVVIEGAGSIAEINLKEHDIANLKVAEMAGAPVVLVADIDRGGVFAQVVGTLDLLEPAERERIGGVIINKFRGDPTLFAPGIDFLEKRTGVPVLGVVPWFPHRLPEEDSVALQRRAKGEGHKAKEENRIRIGVIRLPRISNYTDFDALEREPDVELVYLEEPEEIEGLDLLILPGSKSTIADLNFLRSRGYAEGICSFRGRVAGICGGYQMLGKRISDPELVESSQRETEGLGLLDVLTVMLAEKQTHRCRADLLPAGFQVAPRCGEQLEGYEIHMGETILGPAANPFAAITERSGKTVEISDGAVSADGRVFGTYLHGIFDNDRFRTCFLDRIRREKGLPLSPSREQQEDPLDLLADHLEKHVDVERVLRLCGSGIAPPPIDETRAPEEEAITPLVEELSGVLPPDIGDR